MLKLLRICHRPACQTLKRLLEVFEVVEQFALVLQMLFYNDSTIEDLFYCVPAQSKTCLFFCQQFLRFGIESVDGNLEYDLAGIG